MVARDEFATKDDLEKSLGRFKEEIIHEFHVVSEGLMDHIKLLAEGHSGVVQRLDRVDAGFHQVETRLDRVETRLDHMEKENERQHIETRALIKLSFSELDKRLSDLESQVKDLQEWRKQIQSRLQA
ncbi:MAG: hypothetical protein QME83_15780 [Thermodesulfobacteriota bacterium]|nr:hypothetical protein [Thermodesulfobacteriota bacterium]